jgi:hypothetical protein
VIDVGPIEQTHIGKGAPVFVLAVGLKRDFLSKGELRGGLLGSRTVGLALLGAVDAAESDTFSAVVVQDLDGVAVENGDDGVVGLTL